MAETCRPSLDTCTHRAAAAAADTHGWRQSRTMHLTAPERQVQAVCKTSKIYLCDRVAGVVLLETTVCSLRSLIPTCAHARVSARVTAKLRAR